MSAAALLTKEKALEIKELKVAMDYLKKLDVNPKGKGIKNLKDAISLICQELDRKGSGPPILDMSKRPPSKGLQKATENDRENRAKLLQWYEHVTSFYKQLPPSYQRDLDSSFPGLENDLVRRKQELRTLDCTIMVVGETAAGKSSLINLLLGGVDLLPVSTLGCTSTICEIRTSKDGKKEGIAYFRSSYENGKKCKKHAPLIFDLNKDKELQRFQQCCRETDEDGDSPYDRVELYYPFPMLEEGIVIVDTPGIGGGGKMGKYAERYLAHSYGLIYVINSANAGGVQKGRLQNFMRLVVNAAGDEGFSGDSTLFVCNRWEQVPDSDKASLLQDTTEKLSRFYKTLKPSQIHCMSVSKLLESLRYGVSSPEHGKLLQLVEDLLPNSLRSRLDSHYRWISAILKRALFSLKVSKVMAAKDMAKAREECETLKKSLEKLKENSRHTLDYMKSNIMDESKRVSNDLLEVMRSKKFTTRIYDWRFDECPQTEDKKRLAKDALDRISNRVALEINHWESDMQIVHKIKGKIIGTFKRDFELLEEQIAKLEGALVDGDTKVVQDLHKSIKKPAPVKQLWKKAKEGSIDEDSNTYKGLGGAIAYATNVSASDKPIKNAFKDYKLRDERRCIEKMQEATDVFLKSLFESKSLQDKINKFFTRFTKGIDVVGKMIPDFIKSDVELITILEEQMQGNEGHLRETFPKLISECYSLQGQLDLYFVHYIMKFDFTLEDLNWDTTEPAIGCGSFADVYVAEMDGKTAGVSKRKLPVALKVCRDPLRENTVTDILLEDKTLRELDHPNIVRYYGATYRFRKDRKQDKQWIMIMEMCKYTLKQKFVNPDVNNPGKMPEDSSSQIQAMLTMADFALQLCEGLLYLHQKGFVHRDLKLENILVTEDDVVKLTDVGLAKPVMDIAFTVAGSPVYMAPEVLLQSQNYDNKADIYSLSIVLWEMWYGKDAADHIQQQLFGPLEKAISDGLRPSFKLSTSPNRSWQDLITRSWMYNPADRPGIQEHRQFFENFIKSHRRR